MKTIVVMLSLLFTGSALPDQPGSDLDKISDAIHLFVKGADQRDLKKIESVLHPQFRAVVNRLFGSADVTVMNRALYLDLLKQEKIGGDDRTIKIKSIDLEGNNAVVKATFLGKETRFDTYIQLVKDTEGKWWLVSDMPSITKR